jgi:hypothetical protein
MYDAMMTTTTTGRGRGRVSPRAAALVDRVTELCRSAAQHLISYHRIASHRILSFHGGGARGTGFAQPPHKPLQAFFLTLRSRPWAPRPSHTHTHTHTHTDTGEGWGRVGDRDAELGSLGEFPGAGAARRRGKRKRKMRRRRRMRRGRRKEEEGVSTFESDALS